MSVRSLGRLTLDLVMQTGNFLGPLDRASRTTRQQMRDISGSIKAASGVITATAGAALAAGSALVAYTNNAAQNARELRNQAQVANAGMVEFQNMAYAVKDVGIEQDQLSGILKDVNDRVGEFLREGGGPMAAFFENVAPKIGLTAEAFRGLSGPQALQLYYDSLEKANVSQQEMTTYLEEMAGDTTALIPLLRDGGAELNAMTAEAERLGFAMTEVEAEQLIEFAGQFDRATAAISSASNALASEFAPYLSVGIDYLFDAADGADGFGDAVSSAVYESIAWLAELVDDFLILDKRVQVSTARMTAGFAQFAEDSWGSISWLLDTAIAGINNLITGMNAIPGFTDLDLIEFSAGSSEWMQGFRDRTAEANAELYDLSLELHDLVTSPGPGAQFMADTQAKIAEITAGLETDDEDSPGRSTLPPGELPNPGGGGGGNKGNDDPINKATDAIKRQILTLEQQVATLGMAEDATKLYEMAQEGATESQLATAKAALEAIAAYEESEKAGEDYQKLLDELRTDEQRLTDQMHERLAVLDAVNVASDEYAETAAKIAEAAFVDAPDFGGLDSSVGGAVGELNKIDEAEEKLQEWYDTQLAMLDQFRQSRADLSEQWDAEERDLKEQHEKELAEIEQARQIAQLAAAESTFGDLAGLASAFAGEQSGIYRALFAVEKSYAIGKALMNAPKSYSDAYAATVGIPIIGPALAPVAGATAAAAQVAQAGAIQGIGMAHDGIDSVPETGTWLLEKGERVTTAETSAKLDATLARVDAQMNRPGDSGGVVGGGLTIHNIDARGATDPAATGREVERAVERAYQRVGEDFATNGNLRRMLGV
ncbi:hypothetical protein ACLUEY_01345 [Vreelandella aquamarina]